MCVRCLRRNNFQLGMRNCCEILSGILTPDLKQLAATNEYEEFSKQSKEEKDKREEEKTSYCHSTAVHVILHDCDLVD